MNKWLKFIEFCKQINSGKEPSFYRAVTVARMLARAIYFPEEREDKNGIKDEYFGNVFPQPLKSLEKAKKK